MERFTSSGEAGVELGQQVLEAIRMSLADAIGDVFFLAFIFVLISTVGAAFIREVPLRDRGGPSRGAPYKPADDAADGTEPLPSTSD